MSLDSPSPQPAPSLRPSQRIARGVTLRLGSVLAFTIMNALVRIAADAHIPVAQVIFFRNAFAFIPIGAYIALTTGFSILRTVRPQAHAIRAVIGLTAMALLFTSLSLLPLSEATAINFSSPLFATALSAVILKEQVRAQRWVAVAVGFVGVLIMLRPDPHHLIALGALAGLGAACFAALATITVRQIAHTEPGPSIAFYFTLAGTLAGAAFLPWVWVRPDMTTWIVLASTGLFGGVGQLLMTEAIRSAPVSVIAPFDYTQLIWAGLIGYLAWGELPLWTTAAGALVVVGSSLYVLHRETRGGISLTPAR